MAMLGTVQAQHLVPQFQAQVNGGDLKTVVGDINGNGLDDLVAHISPYSFVACVDPWLNGLNTWLPLAPSGLNLAVDDLDRDGVDDMLFITAGQTIDVVQSTGTGVLNSPPVTIVPPTALVGGFAVGFGVIDLNNDGWLDIVRGVNFSFSASSSLEVWLRTAPLTYTLASVTANVFQGGFFEPIFDDFDGDGFMDFAMSRSPANAMPGPGNVFTEVILGAGLGNGQFAPVTVVATNLSFGPSTVVYGPRGATDFSGDGLPDLLFTELIGNVTPELSFLPSQAGGGFGAPQSLGIPIDPRIPSHFALGDLDGDGNSEIYYGEQRGNPLGGVPDARLQIIRGLGAGVFRPGRPLASVPNSDRWFPYLGDFRGTGVLDLIIKSRDILFGQSRTYVYLENQTIFSAGCPGSQGPMSILPDNPALGNTGFVLSLLGAPPGRQALVGLSLARVPLTNPCFPVLDLSAGSLLLPQGNYGLLNTSAVGSALLSVPIPNTPAIMGVPFFVQWAVDDPGGYLALSEARTFVVW